MSKGRGNNSSDSSADLGNTGLLDAEVALNPGPYEDLHRKTKDIYPAIFEGLRFVVNKGLSSHFQVSHSLILSSLLPSTYKFGTTYVGSKQASPIEMYPIILGDYDSSGNMNAQILHQFIPNLKTRIVAQIQENQLAAYQMTNDYKGKNYTASLTAVNTDMINNSGIFLFHYLQRVTRKLDLGSELLVQYGPNVPNKLVAMYSFGWRYFGKQWQFSGALNPLGSLHLCYHQQPSSQIQYGVEMETNLRTMEALSTFMYQVDLSKANLTFKGMVDSNWNCGAVMEERLLPLPFTFVLSGFLNHVKSNYKFGIGFTIG